jgi:hypothetical protein
MLSVVMLNVITLNVLAPESAPKNFFTATITNQMLVAALQTNRRGNANSLKPYKELYSGRLLPWLKI